MGKRYISDLETNGFLESVTTVHCAVLKDIDTGEARGFLNHEMDEYIALLEAADLVVWHNGIKFDVPVLRKLYPHIQLDDLKMLDTMVIGRLVHPDIKSSDFIRARLWREYTEFENKLVDWETLRDEYEALTPEQREDLSYEKARSYQRLAHRPVWSGNVPKPFPGKMIGSHSLAAWGYRLGEHKGDYDGGFDVFSEEMFDYMMQDAEVTWLLFTKLMAHQPSEQSLALEHRIARLCFQIETNGYPFNVQAALALYGRLVDEREALRRQLVGLFPNWTIPLPDFIPKRNNKTKGYIAGVPVKRQKEMEFNPSSRAHIADRLINKYGWKPTEFTQKAEKDESGATVQPGSPKIDDEVLSRLPYPEAKQLARSFLLDKRIGQIGEGAQAWLKVQREGKIHARYTPNGTVTGRSTHSHPNISQVPRVSSEFGRECRELFHVPAGWVQLGADQQGLELRCLASDLSGLAGDGGNYARIVTQGDVHTTNMLAAGLPDRDRAKTFIYAFLYGAGDEKIGSIAGKGALLGKKLKAAFLAKTPGLEKLIKAVKGAAARGWIKGIDGRKVPIRSTHSALNMRLQNAGAVVCKQWGCDWDDALRNAGLKHGWDGDYVFLSWSHDEYQLAVRDDPALIETVRQHGIATGRAAGKPFNFQCPLDVEVKTGSNWAECH